jgi:hypothetical protein
MKISFLAKEDQNLCVTRFSVTKNEDIYNRVHNMSLKKEINSNLQFGIEMEFYTLCKLPENMSLAPGGKFNKGKIRF